MIAKIRLHDLRHTTPGRLLSEIGAKLGSPLLEFGQLGPQAPDLAVDARQLRPGLLFADVTVAELAPATEAEKQSQLDRLADVQARHAETAPAALRRLKEPAAGEQNVFAALMEAVRHCSLGQISEAFFEVGGQYRRNV